MQAGTELRPRADGGPFRQAARGTFEAGASARTFPHRWSLEPSRRWPARSWPRVPPARSATTGAAVGFVPRDLAHAVPRRTRD